MDNCLSLIQDRLQRYDNSFVNREFEGAIVMAKYGPHRTYKVHLDGYDQSVLLAGEGAGARSTVFYFDDNAIYFIL